MDIYRWTSLGRTYDLNLRHNRLILAVSLFGTFIIAGGKAINGGGEWLDVVLLALTAGATVFSAGMFAKEIYPDHPHASLAAAVIGLPVAWYARPAGLPVLFWLVACQRVLNRSTGLAPKSSDILVVGLVAAWLVWQVSPLFGFLTGSILWLDALLPGGQRANRLTGITFLLMTVAYIAFRGGIGGPLPVNGRLVLTLLSLTVIFIPVMLHSYDLQATGDATGERLIPARVQAGQFASLAAGLVLASWMGVEGATLLVALWAAILSVSVHQISRLVGQRVAVTA